MHMYWSKGTPEHAHRVTLELNDKYWCYGLHDRAWAERDIFGKVRYMSLEGLERKFDMAAYVDWVDELVARER